MALRMLRRSEACERIKEGPTTLKNRIKAGLFTPGVPVSTRLSLWPEHEVEAINAARIAGKTPDEIRALVTGLLAERKNALAALGR